MNDPMNRLITPALILAALILSADMLIGAPQAVLSYPLALLPTPTPTCSVALAYGYQPAPLDMVSAFDQAAQNDPNTANTRPSYTPAARGVPAQYPGGTGVTYVTVSPSEPIANRLLKAMGWQESNWRQFDAAYGGSGYTYRTGCDYGVMQINENSMGGMDSGRIASLYVYNVGAGTRVLIDKWNWMSTPTYRLISPNNHTLPESCYYAVTAYNGWSDSNDPNNSGLFKARRPPFDGTQFATDYPYQEVIWGYMAHPASSPGGGQLWSSVRVPWVPRGVFGSWQPQNWRPAEWTPRPTFYYVPEIKASSAGWDSYIVVQNPRGDYTLAVDIALYNPDGSFYKWWLEAPDRDDSVPVRLAPYASRVLQVVGGLPAGSTFSGSAVIAASQDAAVSVIRVHQGAPYASAIYNAIESPSNTAYLPLLHRNNGSWNSEIVVQNVGSVDASVTVSYYARPGSGTSCNTTSPAIPPLGSYTFALRNNPGCDIGSPFVGAATVSSAQPIAVLSNQLRDDAGDGTVESLMSYEGFPTGAQLLSAPLLMVNNNGWSTSLNIYNHNGSSNSVQIGYREKQGAGNWNGSQTVAPTANGVVTINPAPPSTLVPPPPSPFVGSGVLTPTAGLPISAIVNESRSPTNFQAMCYGTTVVGGTKVVLPLALKDKSDWLGQGPWTTGLGVLNLSTTASANVTVTCYWPNGTVAGSGSYTISARKVQVVNPLPGVGSGFLGSAVITSNQNIAVAVNHIVMSATSDAAMSHLGIQR